MLKKTALHFSIVNKKISLEVIIYVYSGRNEISFNVSSYSIFQFIGATLLLIIKRSKKPENTYIFNHIREVFINKKICRAHAKVRWLIAFYDELQMPGKRNIDEEMNMHIKLHTCTYIHIFKSTIAPTYQHFDM